MDQTDSEDLAAYVVWVPRNRARERHVKRVTGIVTDPRARHYWDAREAVVTAYEERYALTGPCAGIFMVFGPDARWEADRPPEAVYAEDAHARQYKRQLPQFDARRFARRVMEMLPARRPD